MQGLARRDYAERKKQREAAAQAEGGAPGSERKTPTPTDTERGGPANGEEGPS